MKKKIKLSIILQIGLLLTFFLPFFPHGCMMVAEEATAVDSTALDTIAIDIDTLYTDSLLEDNTALVKQETDTLKTATIDNSVKNTNKPASNNDNKELSERLSDKSTLLKSLLRPNNNYTGIATLIDSFSFLPFGFGLGIAFILWILSLIIKLKDFNNIFIFINVTGTILLSFSHSLEIFGSNKRLWGFWVCLVWSILMIIYDFFILKKKKNTSA